MDKFEALLNQLISYVFVYQAYIMITALKNCTKLKVTLLTPVLTFYFVFTDSVGCIHDSCTSRNFSSKHCPLYAGNKTIFIVDPFIVDTVRINRWKV